MPDVLYLCSYYTGADALPSTTVNVNKKFDRVGVAIKEIFLEVHELNWNSDEFHSTLLEIATSVTLERKDRSGF
eukprot:IDg3498t1